jgi:hypothetical protein
MSISSDLKEMDRQRKREIAIRAVLARNAASHAPEVKEQRTETSKPTAGEVKETSTDEPLPVLPAYNPATSPARVVGAPGKPWMRGNVQWRPMNSRERQAEQDERMDKKALADLQAYRDLQQRTHDEQTLLDAEQAKRTEREIRTGTRHLPHSKGAGYDYISMAEAKERGLL